MMLFDPAGAMRQGLEEGRQTRIGRLAGEAYNAPVADRQAALGNLARTDASAALNMGRGMSMADNDATTRLGQYARALTSAPEASRAALYQRIKPELRNLGIEAPEQYDETVAQTALALANAFQSSEGTPAGLRELQGKIQAAGLDDEQAQLAYMVDLGLKGRASSAGFRPVTVTGEDGLDRTFTFSGRDGSWVDARGNPATPREQQRIQQQETQQQPPQPAVGQVPTAIQQSEPVPQVPADFLADFNAYRAESGQPPATPEEAAQMYANLNTPAQPAQAPQGGMGAPMPQQGMGMPQAAPQGGIDPFTSRSPEATAAATRRAQLEAELDLAPRQAEAAGRQAEVTTERTEMARQGTQFAAELREKATMAQTENNRLSALERSLSDAYTGAGANQILQARRLAGAFGIGDAETLGAMELSAALSNQLALGMRNPTGGEGMPGNLSNADRNFLVQSVPGIAQSTDGWRSLIQIRRKLNDYTTRQNREAREYLADGNPAAQLPDHMQQWADQNPLFEDFQPTGGRRTLIGEAEEIGGQARGAAEQMRGQPEPSDDIEELLRRYGG